MQLVEKGRLYLEQPVADLIKEFNTDMHRGITLFHLLPHTSGLAPDPGFSLEPIPRWSQKIPDVDTVIRESITGVVSFKPGEGSHVDDINYGLGWSIPKRGIISPETYAREGAGRSAMYIDPKEDLIAVFFVPTTIQWLPESVITPLSVIWSGLL